MVEFFAEGGNSNKTTQLTQTLYPTTTYKLLPLSIRIFHLDTPPQIYSHTLPGSAAVSLTTNTNPLAPGKTSFCLTYC